MALMRISLTLFSFLFLSIKIITCNIGEGNKTTNEVKVKNVDAHYDLKITNAGHTELGGVGLHLISEQDISHDSIYIFDVNTVLDSVRLSKSLWKIVFQSYGGSGMSLRRTIFFLESEGKLYKSIDMISSYKSQIDHRLFGKSYDKENYESEENHTLEYSYIPKQNQMRISEFYKHTSNESTRVDSTFAEEFILQFNDQLNIFYTNLLPLQGLFILIKELEEYPIELSLNEVPSITLKGDIYYFINNKWYLKGNDDYLVEMY